MLVSLDLFIPSLLGRWGCTVRGCTHHHTLTPQQGGHDRGHSSRMAASISCSTGELGLLPSPPSATHQGRACHVLSACTSSVPSFYLVASICASVPGEGVYRATSLLLFQAEAGRGGSIPVFAVMRVLERQGAIFSFESVLGCNFS